MSTKQSKLQQLRMRAEHALKTIGSTPDLPTYNVDELIHELHVYHTELELQIEDLQLAYRQVSTAQQRYASLFNNAPVGFVLTDSAGKILDANLTAAVMLSVERSSLKNRLLSDVITATYQDTYHLHRRAILNTLQPHDCEVQLHRKDGTIFHAHLRTYVHDGDSDPQLHTAITDISALKQTQEALQQAFNQEQQTNQLRMRVLSVVAHEFRTPLTVILTSVEMLERYGDRMPDEKKHERYATIRNLVWYLNDIVQDISMAQEFGADLPQLKLKTFNLLPILHQLIADVSVMAAKKQEIILYINGHDAGEMVTWDENLVRRILMDLLGNALKYSDTDVICSVESQKETIIFRIEDHGIGIPEEDQQYIYEAFYRGKNAELIHGTGIGLYVVSRTVEAHQGRIECQSIVGQGTTFIVELPRDASLVAVE